MPPETHPLIESITETLADNAERRMDANAFLDKNFDAAHPSVADVTARLEVAAQRKFRVLRKVLPWVLAALAIAAVVFANASAIRFALSVYKNGFLGSLEKPVLSVQNAGNMVVELESGQRGGNGRFLRTIRSLPPTFQNSIPPFTKAQCQCTQLAPGFFVCSELSH